MRKVYMSSSFKPYYIVPLDVISIDDPRYVACIRFDVTGTYLNWERLTNYIEMTVIPEDIKSIISGPFFELDCLKGLQDFTIYTISKNLELT